MKQINYYKSLLLVSLLLVTGTAAQAQTLFTQQWFSRVNRNPAAAALGNGDINLGLFYRNQWTGLEGAPQTTMVNADAYVDAIQSGFGLTFLYDQNGKSTYDINATISYAYRLRLGDEWKLALGVAGGIMNISKDPSRDQFADPSIGIPMERYNTLTADFNAGIEAAFRGFTVGAAVDHILGNNSGSSLNPKAEREYYVYGRYNFALPANFELAPQVGWDYIDKDNVFEVGATATYNKLVWLGVNWKSERAIGLFAGVKFSGIGLGYAYEHSLGSLSNLAANTHEIMLQIAIGYKNEKK